MEWREHITLWSHDELSSVLGINGYRKSSRAALGTFALKAEVLKLYLPRMVESEKDFY